MNTVSTWLTALALLSGPMIANAATVQWILNGVTTSDGEAITGSFDFTPGPSNAVGAAGTYSDVSITTSGSATSGQWGPQSFSHSANQNNNYGIFTSYAPTIGDVALELAFVTAGTNAALTSAGGTVDLLTPATVPGSGLRYQDTVAFGICGDPTCSAAGESISSLLAVNITGGSITGTALLPVPLPASAWMMLSGLGILGWVARRKSVGKPHR